MLKKTFVRNVNHQMLLNTDSRSLEFLQSLIGRTNCFKYISVSNANIDGIMLKLISSACLI